MDRAFIWRQDTGMLELSGIPLLVNGPPQDSIRTDAKLVSRHGDIVWGEIKGLPPGAQQFFRWTEETGMVIFHGIRAVQESSANGDYLLAQGVGYRFCLWDEINGCRDIQHILQRLVSANPCVKVGDMKEDCIVGAADADILLHCMDNHLYQGACYRADLDQSVTVDLRDCAIFQRVFVGHQAQRRCGRAVPPYAFAISAAGTTTSIAPGTTRIVTGVSAIASPSAHSSCGVSASMVSSRVS